MQDYQRDFIRFIVERGALRFGDFKTKSGRQSPYFFNAGGLCSGADLVRLGEFYACAIHAQFEHHVNIIYGPAYKGIPLSVAASASLFQLFGEDVSYCFNRKEAKDHGEKGGLVGKVPGAGDRLVIVDDVITAGLSIQETTSLLATLPGVKIAGVLVALDRQERGTEGPGSALTQIEKEHGFPVRSIIKLEHVLMSIDNGDIPAAKGFGDRIRAYREMYGV